MRETQLYRDPLFHKGGIIHVQEESDPEPTLWTVQRRLWPHTSQEEAEAIHERLGTEKLLRDWNGWWYCCVGVCDVEYNDTEQTTPISIEKGSDT